MENVTAVRMKGCSGSNNTGEFQNLYIKGNTIRYVHMSRIDPFYAVEAHTKKIIQHQREIAGKNHRRLVKGDGGQAAAAAATGAAAAATPQDGW